MISVILLSLTVCSSKENIEPSISITAEITSVNEQQFQAIGTTGIEKPCKNDFEIFKFCLHEKDYNNLKNRESLVPDFKKIFNNYRDDLYWFGHSSIQDNENINLAKYSYDITLYRRGLDEASLRKILNSKEVTISWSTEDGQQKKKSYKVGDLLRFK